MNSAGVTTSMSLTMIIASSIPWPPESPKEEEEDDNREESTLEPYPALVPTVGMILSVVGGSKVVNEELCNAGIKAMLVFVSRGMERAHFTGAANMKKSEK